MNFIDILDQDLKQLLYETKRKYPTIRDDTQSAINQLSQYKMENS